MKAMEAFIILYKFGDNDIDNLNRVIAEAISEYEQSKNKLPDDFICDWPIQGVTDCAYRDKKCHICTKAGFEPEIKNYFAPYRINKCEHIHQTWNGDIGRYVCDNCNQTV